MNQAILKIIEDSKKLHSTPMGIMVTEYFEKQLSSLPSDTQGYTKKEVLDFAYWYHNGLLNRDRGDVEVEFDDFIKYHRKGLIPNKIIGN